MAPLKTAPAVPGLREVTPIEVAESLIHRPVTKPPGAEEVPDRLRGALANRNVEQRLSVRASAFGIEARLEEKTQRVRPPPCSRGTQGSTPRRLRCSRGQELHEVVVCIADRHFE